MLTVIETLLFQKQWPLYWTEEVGVSVRTLQGWEQGRKQPSGAARTLLTIARNNPKALLAAVGKH